MTAQIIQFPIRERYRRIGYRAGIYYNRVKEQERTRIIEGEGGGVLIGRVPVTWNSGLREWQAIDNNFDPPPPNAA